MNAWFVMLELVGVFLAGFAIGRYWEYRRLVNIKGYRSARIMEKEFAQRLDIILRENARLKAQLSCIEDNYVNNTVMHA